jgi:biotin carboxyl carrier protein
MPGRIVGISVAVGERVKKGQALVALEAMKMEHGLVAPFDGVVAELPVRAGEQVAEGVLVVRIAADS